MNTIESMMDQGDMRKAQEHERVAREVALAVLQNNGSVSELIRALGGMDVTQERALNIFYELEDEGLAFIGSQFDAHITDQGEQRMRIPTETSIMSQELAATVVYGEQQKKAIGQALLAIIERDQGASD